MSVIHFFNNYQPRNGAVQGNTGDNTIPYASYVDITYRICLSIFDLPAGIVDTEKECMPHKKGAGDRLLLISAG